MKRALLLMATLAFVWSLQAQAADPPKAAKGPAKVAASEKPMAEAPKHVLVTPADLKWVDGPAALPKGVKSCVLEGNPEGPGPFTIRFLVPDGYRIPPHSHSGLEHLTVIQGSMFLAMGDTWDQTKGVEIPAGGFAVMPPQMRHYAWAKGETIGQVHGMGPWTINYVNPTDDPRNAQGASAPADTK